jgi:hypothetical protein
MLMVYGTELKCMSWHLVAYLLKVVKSVNEKSFAETGISPEVCAVGIANNQQFFFNYCNEFKILSATY